MSACLSETFNCRSLTILDYALEKFGGFVSARGTAILNG